MQTLFRIQCYGITNQLFIDIKGAKMIDDQFQT